MQSREEESAPSARCGAKVCASGRSCKMSGSISSAPCQSRCVRATVPTSARRAARCIASGGARNCELQFGVAFCHAFDQVGEVKTPQVIGDTALSLEPEPENLVQSHTSNITLVLITCLEHYRKFTARRLPSSRRLMRRCSQQTTSISSVRPRAPRG